MILRRFFLASFLVLAACGGSAESSEPVTPPAAAAEANDEGEADASQEAAADECTSRGYECHPNPTCNAEYMPLSNISCGAKGGFCCIKGAMPPSP